jgi:hypothetical protein
MTPCIYLYLTRAVRRTHRTRRPQLVEGRGERQGLRGEAISAGRRADPIRIAAAGHGRGADGVRKP